MIVHLWWWIERFTGASNTSGVAYGMWSGFGSDLTEFLMLGGIIQIFRAHNCHVRGCWRVGKYQLGPYKVCKHHNPGIPKGDITYDHIVKEHKRVY